ncbi:MAG: S8 family serine peptidase [Bacillota bacterium]|nr:S8 family serine peptidase [Bacillota bacterium]
MFSLRNKLDDNLKAAIDSNTYKNYRVIIHCKNLQDAAEKKVKAYRGEVIRSISSIGCFSANISSRVINKLIEYPQVSYITFDDFAFLCGNSILTSNKVTSTMKHNYTGKGICIGVVDSGVYPHPDLINSGSKIRGFVDLLSGLNYPYDDNGHGTFICGLLSANGNSSKSAYKGIAEDAEIYVIKAFNAQGRGYISDILFAIEKLILESVNFNIRVLCLPFELTTYNSFILSQFSLLFNMAAEKNIIIVVPSGNNGIAESSLRGIAVLHNCITVGGLDTRGSIDVYKYSSSGPCGKPEKPDLSAGCVDIASLNSDTSYISEKNGVRLYAKKLVKPYVSYTGTSCAAAYISGVCALLLEKNSNLTYKDVLSLLKMNCILTKIPSRIQGAGMIDLGKLLE